MIKGRGFGHGVGMSQYGAYGFAQGPRLRRRSCATTTAARTIGKTRQPQMIRVLLEIDRATSTSAAPAAPAAATLSEVATSTAPATRARRPAAQRTGARLKGCGQMLRTASRGDTCSATAPTAGRCEVVRPTEPRVAERDQRRSNVNDYVQGVVAGEMPPRWPIDALRAQAVAARTYAPDDQGRRQRLRPLRRHPQPGLRRRRHRDRAHQPGRRRTPRYQVVKLPGQGRADLLLLHLRRPHRENEIFLGGTPMPYLRGVRDPYDYPSPLHTWTSATRPRRCRPRLAGIVTRPAAADRDRQARRLAAHRPARSDRHPRQQLDPRRHAAVRARRPDSWALLPRMDAWGLPPSSAEPRLSRRGRAGSGCRGRSRASRTHTRRPPSARAGRRACPRAGRRARGRRSSS